jgi:hypothetical protein
MWNRGKIWRIGLGENAVVGHEAQEIVVSPFPEGDDAAERDVPPGSDCSFSEPVRAGVAVQHSTYARLACLNDHRACIDFRVTGVHHYRTLHLARECKLLRKRATLLHSRRIVIMVVEATLADRDRASADVHAKLIDVAQRIECARIMRVDAGGVPDVSPIRRSHCPGCASGAEDIPSAASGADADYCFGPALSRARDYIAAVAFERLVCEVRVTVDEPFDIPVFLGHFLSIQSRVGLAM